MNAATHPVHHLHLPVTWLIGLIVVLAVVVLTSLAMSGWGRVGSPSGPASAQHLAMPAPAPAPMPLPPSAYR